MNDGLFFLSLPALLTHFVAEHEATGLPKLTCYDVVSRPRAVDPNVLSKPHIQGAMIPTSEKKFYYALLLGLLLCAGLYAEEAFHFVRYGMNTLDTSSHVRDITKCQSVGGSSVEFVCPINGYNSALYRYGDHSDPYHNTPNDIFVVY